MATETRKQAIWNAQIVKGAVISSFLKLNPIKMMGNPVMFVVEVGSVITTLLLVRDLAKRGPGIGFDLQITLWLWFTVLFANFRRRWRKDAARPRPITCANPRLKRLRIGCWLTKRQKTLRPLSCERMIS